MKKYNFIKQIIINHEQLVKMSNDVRSNIIKFYKGLYDEPDIVVITILNGGLFFSRSVLIDCYIPMDFKITRHAIVAHIYYTDDRSSGRVEVKMGDPEREKEIGESIKGREVLIVDDIHDSGRTLSKVIEKIKEYSPLNIECCVMIERVWGKRERDVRPKFVGHFVHLPDFLVGAGLDYEGKYRDLPYIGTVKPDFKEEHHMEHVCNKCGELCASQERCGYYGLLDAVAKGSYYSSILEDCTAYQFDLCEGCLKELFDSFVIPVEEREYHVWTGKVCG